MAICCRICRPQPTVGPNSPVVVQPAQPDDLDQFRRKPARISRSCGCGPSGYNLALSRLMRVMGEHAPVRSTGTATRYSSRPARLRMLLALIAIIRGDGPFVRPFPGSERLMTLAEVQELQLRLTKLGFDTDGSVGRDTQRAVRDFQRKVGMAPADGYAGLKVLARLRQAS